MATSSAHKNGHELAAAWLRRERQDEPTHRRPDQQPASGEDTATSQAVFHCDRNRGFFRA